MSVVSTINNTENYGEHRSWIDVDGGRYGDRLCHSPHRYLAMDAIKAAVEILTAGKGQVIKIEKL